MVFGLAKNREPGLFGKRVGLRTPAPLNQDLVTSERYLRPGARINPGGYHTMNHVNKNTTWGLAKRGSEFEVVYNVAKEKFLVFKNNNLVGEFDTEDEVYDVIG